MRSLPRLAFLFRYTVKLPYEEIAAILDTADGLKEISERSIKKVPTLRGKTVVLFFHEPSTRTRVSFDIAAKRLSADAISISASSSSLVKGETLIDTARNLEAMKPDVIVIRHASAGTPFLLSQKKAFPVKQDKACLWAFPPALPQFPRPCQPMPCSTLSMQSAQAPISCPLPQ